MKSLEEIRKTPVLQLTDDEIGQLDPESQEWARKAKSQRALEETCPGHEKVSTGTWEDSRRGWHPGYCKNCGMDMSLDSGG